MSVFGQNYQRAFDTEERLKNKVAISKVALKALVKDEQIQDCLENSGKSFPLSEWFTATEINLNGDKYPDLIVEPVSRCRTAMRPPYWILLNKRNKYELVLTTNTFFLYINKERTNDYFNVTTDWSTASTRYTITYGFDSKKYIEIAKKERPNL